MAGRDTGRHHSTGKVAWNPKPAYAVERLANYLLGHSRRMDGPFDVLIEKRRRASCLGMTPESLSRACSTLAACRVRVEGAHHAGRRRGAGATARTGSADRLRLLSAAQRLASAAA